MGCEAAGGRVLLEIGEPLPVCREGRLLRPETGWRWERDERVLVPVEQPELAVRDEGEHPMMGEGADIDGRSVRHALDRLCSPTAAVYDRGDRCGRRERKERRCES